MAAKRLGLTLSASIAAATLVICGPVWASAPAEIRVTLKNHRFEPSTFTVPAGQKVRVTLINRDAASEEFDSHDLHVEEDVTPMGRISFNIGPLQAGQYSFMGELHSDTAQGAVTALSPGR
ncbi:MAG TPA: cupredoxin domain-containing protein [Caulobacteraceae bacterium]